MSDVKVDFDLDVDSSSTKTAIDETKKLEAAIKAAAAADDKAAASAAAAAVAQKNRAAEMISAAYQRSQLNASVAKIEARQAAAMKVGGGFASATSAMRASSSAQAAGMEKQNTLSELSAQFAKREAAAHLTNRSAYEKFKESVKGVTGPRDTGADTRYNVKGSGASHVMSKVLGGAESLFGKGSANTIMEALGGVTQLDGALAKMGTSLSGVVGVGMTAVGVGAAAAVVGVLALAAAIGAVVAGLGALAVQGTIAFSKFTIETGMFREDSLNAFNAILKNRKLASDMYDRAIKVAADTPFETMDTIDTFKTLMGGGFKATEVEKITRAFADLSVIKPGGLKDATEAMVKLRGTGKLTEEVLERFQTAGISKKMIADATGIKMSEVSKLTGAKAEEAIMKAIALGAGGGGAVKAKALSGLWSTLTSRPFEMFNKALSKSEGDGAGIANFYNVIKDAVSDLVDVFDTDKASGGKFVGAINAIGQALAIVGRVALEFGRGLFSGLVEGWEAVGGDKGTAAISNMRDMASLGEAFKTIGKALGYVIGAGAALGFMFGSLAAGVDKISQYGDTIKAIGIGLLVAAAAVAIVAISIGAFVGMLLIPVYGGLIIIGVVIAGIALAILAIPIAIAATVAMVVYLISQIGGIGAAFAEAGNAARSALGFGAGDLGAESAFSGKSLPGGFTLSSVVPSPSSLNQPAPSAGKGGDQNVNNNITVSGIGLDLSQLAQLIKSQVGQAMAEAAGA